MTKRQDQDNGQLLILIAIVFFLPFALISFFCFKHLQRRYPQTSSSQRVFDSGVIFNTLPLCGGALLIGAYLIHLTWYGLHPVVSVAVFGPMTAWLCYKLAKLLAAKYQGVTADSATDILSMPFDFANLSIVEYIQLRFLTRLGETEEIAISSIDRITREAGKSLHIHGRFGSRGIHFSNKQKRDECLAMLRRYTKAQIMFDGGS
ncbi:hypothetical protein LJR066_003294 [Acidovorax sp. LjRoot66]|uniref:hypothetical protein n=1 Tax=Acidovorax sp. LjRoot66 TaxID=3342334 RepID=UPI003ECEBF5F